MTKPASSAVNHSVRRLCQEINAELDRRKLQTLLYQLQQLLDKQRKPSAQSLALWEDENPYDRMMLG